MTTYTPDRWVVLELTNDEHGKIRKVLAGWHGGYLNGDSWKMNSGITETVETDEYFDFHGYSGSVYRCYKHNYGMNMYMSSILAQMQDIIAATPSNSIEIVPDYDQEKKHVPIRNL